VAAQSTGEHEQDLRAERKVVLRALMVVRSQTEVLADHIAGMERQIRSAEQNLVVLRLQTRDTQIGGLGT
jgi:hypothetical protein